MAQLDQSRKIELGVAGLVSVAMVALIVFVEVAAAGYRNRSPELEPVAVFPDFSSIADIDVKKQQFFDYLQDYVVAENEAIRELRAEIQVYADVVNSSAGLSQRERDHVLELAEEYRIDTEELSERGIVNTLMRRVDELPVSLVLAQAANESAWGTSRFTLEGNNLFGQWCYNLGCGMVPLQRRQGASHEVEEFTSVAEAVSAYFYNINTHPTYRNLRDMRESMRNQGRELDSMQLALGLARYSERGDNYVDEIQTLIEQNNLKRRDRV